MAWTFQASTLSSYSKPLLTTILLLTTQPVSLFAQLQHPPGDSTSSPAAASPTTAPVLIIDPAGGDTLAAATTPALASVPSTTDSAGYAPHNSTNNGNTSDKSVLNYYFLLLVVLVIVVAVVYWSITRRRRHRTLQGRSNQQSALERDLEYWPGRRRGGRWRHAVGETRAEEGLDERGEAPPPYLKEPEAVHHRVAGDEAMEMGDMARREGKPPDYDERSVGRSD